VYWLSSHLYTVKVLSSSLSGSTQALLWQWFLHCEEVVFYYTEGYFFFVNEIYVVENESEYGAHVKAEILLYYVIIII